MSRSQQQPECSTRLASSWVRASDGLVNVKAGRQAGRQAGWEADQPNTARACGSRAAHLTSPRLMVSRRTPGGKLGNVGAHQTETCVTIPFHLLIPI